MKLHTLSINYSTMFHRTVYLRTIFLTKVFHLVVIGLIRAITAAMVVVTTKLVVVYHRRHGKCEGSLLLLTQGPELSRGTILHHLYEIARVGCLMILYCLYVSDRRVIYCCIILSIIVKKFDYLKLVVDKQWSKGSWRKDF